MRERSGIQDGGHDSTTRQVNTGRTNVDEIDSREENSFFEKKISSFDSYLTTKETAEYLRSTPKQVRKWVYQGKVKAYKLFSKSLRFKKSDLELLFKGGSTWE
jgi:excisionase family DNA binding protein